MSYLFATVKGLDFDLSRVCLVDDVDICRHHLSIYELVVG